MSIIIYLKKLGVSSMAYFTIKDRAQDEFEEKKSTFIGHIKRVETEDEAKEFVAEIKEKYKDARHNVYAYIVGENMGIQRYNDDGEPKGTGGIPALEVLKKNELKDVAVVVTRYFGGIKLGASGLARAYGKGAAIAVKAGGVVEKVKGRVMNISMAYDMLGKIQYLCETEDWHIEDVLYTDKVEVIMLVESTMVETLKKAMIETSAGKVEIELSDEDYYFKMENRLFEVC